MDVFRPCPGSGLLASDKLATTPSQAWSYFAAGLSCHLKLQLAATVMRGDWPK